MYIETRLDHVMCPKCKKTGNQAEVGDYTDQDDNEMDSTSYATIECCECNETFHLRIKTDVSIENPG
jgi:hypothetical protein